MDGCRNDFDAIRGPYMRFGKRTLDLIGSACAITALLPIFLVSASLIKVTSAGPIFFLQDRPGRDGRIFPIIKFRSMRTFKDSYDAQGNELTNDERVTKVGSLLRRTSLDELPQLFNVLLGQMSLVGPRPGLAYQAERYDAMQKHRLNVRQGITGLAQVHGRNALDWEAKIALDLEYVGNVTLRGDLAILVKTVGVVFSGTGVRFEKHDPLSDHGGRLRQHIGEGKEAKDK